MADRGAIMRGCHASVAQRKREVAAWAERQRRRNFATGASRSDVLKGACQRVSERDETALGEAVSSFERGETVLHREVDERTNRERFVEKAFRESEIDV